MILSIFAVSYKNRGGAYLANVHLTCRLSWIEFMGWQSATALVSLHALSQLFRRYKPFKEVSDNDLAKILAFSLSLFFLSALMIKVSATDDEDQRIFGILLVLILCAGPVAVVFEMIAPYLGPLKLYILKCLSDGKENLKKKKKKTTAEVEAGFKEEMLAQSMKNGAVGGNGLEVASFGSNAARQEEEEALNGRLEAIHEALGVALRRRRRQKLGADVVRGSSLEARALAADLTEELDAAAHVNVLRGGGNGAGKRGRGRHGGGVWVERAWYGDLTSTATAATTVDAFLDVTGAVATACRGHMGPFGDGGLVLNAGGALTLDEVFGWRRPSGPNEGSSSARRGGTEESKDGESPWDEEVASGGGEAKRSLRVHIRLDDGDLGGTLFELRTAAASQGGRVAVIVEAAAREGAEGLESNWPLEAVEGALRRFGATIADARARCA